MWYKTFFNKNYIKYLRETSHEKALAFQLSLIKKYLKKTDIALDVACGYGRHLIPLLKEGYNLVGVDLSRDMINDLLKECPAAKVFVADMRSFKIDSKFDLAYCMYSSFGYFKNREEDTKALSNISSHLKSGSIFILDLKNSNKTFQEEMTKEFGGKVYNYKINRYCKEDITMMLKETNLTPFDFYGDYNLIQYSSNSPRMIIVSRKIKSELVMHN